MSPVYISICTPDDRLLQLNEEQNRGCNQDNAHPHHDIDARRAEQCLHWGQVGKTTLKNNKHADRYQHITVSQQAIEIEHTRLDVSGIEQIEDLEHDQRIDCNGARQLDAGAVFAFPEKQTECACYHDE